jgi:hypothetical protein
MKVLVCGDRNWTNIDAIKRELLAFGPGTIIVHGACRGADTFAGIVAGELGYEVREYPAEWAKYGRAAGPIRNRQMLEEEPTLVLAFHEDFPSSKGTKDMVKAAKARGIATRLVKE